MKGDDQKGGKGRLTAPERLRVAYLSQCEGKPDYPSYTAAWSALQRRNRRRGSAHRAKRLEVYHCPHCGRYHIGRK